jgi:hypothetical protein
MLFCFRKRWNLQNCPPLLPPTLPNNFAPPRMKMTCNTMACWGGSACFLPPETGKKHDLFSSAETSILCIWGTEGTNTISHIQWKYFTCCQINTHSLNNSNESESILSWKKCTVLVALPYVSCEFYVNPYSAVKNDRKTTISTFCSRFSGLWGQEWQDGCPLFPDSEVKNGRIAVIYFLYLEHILAGWLPLCFLPQTEWLSIPLG